jgi:two-component system response regulator YesN
MREILSLVIVEDEEYVVAGLQKQIKWNELEIKIAGIAEDGIDGLKLIKELKPDLVLVDIRMPHLDGITMIERLSEQHISPLFIILSGYNDFEYAQRALRCGVVDYLLKPSLPEDISRSLNYVAEKCRWEKQQIFRYHGGNRVNQDNIDKYPKIIRKAIGLICLRYNEGITLNEIADELMITPNYLSALFSRSTGKNFSSYITYYRIERAKNLLEKGNFKIYEVGKMVGYQDSEYFSRIFKKLVGISPSGYYK